MTSPVNHNTPTNFSQDPRWSEAQKEREAGHECNRRSDHHIARALDHLGDKHYGSMLEQTAKGVEKAVEARSHYSNANRKENAILRDASSEKGCVLC